MAEIEPEPTNHRDRSLGLLLFGSLEILIGTATAVLIPLGLAIVKMMGLPADPRSTIPVAALYFIAAIVFIVLGIASIRARRWAREVWLSLSWIWLLTGICSLVVSCFMLPILLRDIGGDAGLAGEDVVLITVITLAALAVLYVVLPAAMVLFYRSPHVAATCRARDPRPQWTDNLPQRLLTLTLLWLLFAASVVVMPAYSWVLPVFGLIWTGGAGALGWLISTAVFVALAWGTSQKRFWAWQGAMALTVIAAGSTVVTFARVDMADVVALMNLPTDQAAAAELISGFGRPAVVLFWLALWGSFAVYLQSIKQAFHRPDNHHG